MFVNIAKERAVTVLSLNFVEIKFGKSFLTFLLTTSSLLDAI